MLRSLSESTVACVTAVILNSTVDGKTYITSEELQKHNKASDLWISIQGKVYNVTEWAKIHPGGGIPLMNLAGQDVIDAFIAFHSGSAWQHLNKLFTLLVEKNEASSLTPTLVEALISQNWLRSKSVSFDIKENLDDLERFKAEMKDLPQAMSTLSVND
ncbi:delta(8)-fatty-acid desaturase-like protein [Tanacetum coccineum]